MKPNGLQSLGLIIAVICRLAPPSAAAPDLVDLRQATVQGSLVRPDLPALVRGTGTLRVIESPPHDLIITWTQTVTLAAHTVQWDSDTVHATHYGLEAWDGVRGAYVLLYETTSNRQAKVTHRFPPTTTTRVRFTVFAHPEHYYALILRRFQFTTP